MLRSFLTASALCAGLMAAPFATADEAGTVWDLASGYEADIFHTRNLVQFAQDVTEATDGALTIDVHPEGALFGAKEIPSAVARGLVPMGEVLAAHMGDKGDIFTLDSVPMIAPSYADATVLWKLSRPQIEALLEEEGLTLLFAVPWPGQVLVSVRPVETLADLKGQALRKYGSASERLIQMIGALPVDVARGKCADAFASGRLAAMIVSSSTASALKAWEFADYAMDISASHPKNLVFVNTDALNALPSDQRQALLHAAEAAEARGWRMSRNDARTMPNTLRAHGMTVTTPSAETAQEIAALGPEIEAWWRAASADKAVAVLDAFQFARAAAAWEETRP